MSARRGADRAQGRPGDFDGSEGENVNDRRTRRRTRRTATVIGALTALLATGCAALPGAGADTGATVRDAPAAPAGKSSKRYADVQRTEELAQAAAEANGEAVEVAGLRQERREVFANPDGSFTAYEYTEPVRAFRGGEWVDIDGTLVRREDGGWSPKAATVELEFSGGGDGPFARMRKAGREYALTWPGGELPAPRIEGDSATYPDVLPGVDLVARAEVDGLAHLLVVRTAEAAANPELASIDFGMRTEGLEVRETADGSLEAVDAAVGGTVFEAGKPVMWDSADTETGTEAEQPAAGQADQASFTVNTEGPGARSSAEAAEGPGRGGRTAPVDVEVSGDTLTLVPDRELLTGEDTVYPVVIDPIQRTTSRSAWTSVMSGMPGEQDWKYSGSAGMGRCPTDYNPVSCNGIGVRRLLFTMPMSFYRGKQILKASFSARVNHVYWADARAEPVQLYRIGGKNHTITSSSDWSNTKDDWDDYLMTVDKKISPTSCSSQANLHFEGGELTSEVSAAASGSWTSMSLGLKAGDESTYGGWKRICGNAYLKIGYNNPPEQIRTAHMSSDPGGKCVWGEGRPYTNVRPQFRTEARDPDHTSSRTDKVKVRFKVDWTGKDGTSRSYTHDTVYKSPNAGTVFSHTMSTQVTGDLQPNSVIYWSANAYDGDAWGGWSHDGDPQRCEIVYDASRPGAPAVTSQEYPEGEVWHDGVGTAGTFTFAPNTDDAIDDGDLVEYRYSFDGETPRTVAADTAGGPASVTWTPMSPGRHWVTVEAFDQAGNPSASAQHEFLVTDGRPVAAQWNLADEADADGVHDESGRYPATAGSAVRFGVTGPGGAADSAARFDGSADAYLDSEATVLDTRDSFSVSAWVRPTALDRDMAVISQDGSGEPGFTLGYDATAGSWAFSMPVGDVSTLGHWKTSAGVTVVPDQWVLLTGVYDAHATGGPQLSVYVNQHLKGTARRGSEWTSHGNLQIGRAVAKSGYRDHFTGDLAEVRVFDRVLPAAQVAELMTVKPERRGYWMLDTATDGTSANVQDGGEPLALNGNASVYRPADPLFDDTALVGDGHLALDGDGDWAATATPPVSGDGSFTITARARLTTDSPAQSQTVFSLPGQNTDRVAVRYQAATGQWELEVSETDAADAPTTVFLEEEQLPVSGGSGQHLAVVYDAFANELRLYVEGQLTATAHGQDDTLWPATGGLQVGRSAQGGGSEYFAGALDEVRVYAGAVDPTGIKKMWQPTAVPDL
ncbi:LamG domain-containing protein [Streptomyces sp. S1A]|uniref:LamG domain-containing protein n=1 Tax=Streptomyces sp. ICN903 TaxID=2964654 RepID=UPI001EDB7EEB|nr:LamG domain-containing protein [Streptomyces sp. ICN903]MCG3039414.1 LamG domain-containing protein [Streptomyces sp. ICN903]